MPAGGFGTAIIDESYSNEDGEYGLGSGQSSVLLRDPQLMQVATTRDDLAVRRLTDSSAPLFARVPTATTTSLVYKDALRQRVNTGTTLRPASMRPVGPAQLLVGTFEDFQFHPTIYSRSGDARGGEQPPRGEPAAGLAGAWRYPYTEVGAVAGAGLVTSMLNFQENRAAQESIEAYAANQETVVMPGATQMYGYESEGLFSTAGSVMGDAPAARTQGVLTTVPASGAVVRGNDADTRDALSVLSGIEDRTIQGERVLAYDNTLRRASGYTDVDQFALR